MRHHTSPIVVPRGNDKREYHRDATKTQTRTHHCALLDGLVTQNFAQRCALAATTDENAPRIRMRQHCNVNQRLVVNKLVLDGALHVSVEHQTFAKRMRIDNFYKLKLGLRRAVVLCHRRLNRIS